MNIHIGETYTYMYMEICKCTKSHADIPVSFYYICKDVLGNILNTKHYKSIRSMFSAFVYSLYLLYSCSYSS